MEYIGHRKSKSVMETHMDIQATHIHAHIHTHSYFLPSLSLEIRKQILLKLYVNYRGMGSEYIRIFVMSEIYEIKIYIYCLLSN